MKNYIIMKNLPQENLFIELSSSKWCKRLSKNQHSPKQQCLDFGFFSAGMQMSKGSVKNPHLPKLYHLAQICSHKQMHETPKAIPKFLDDEDDEIIQSLLVAHTIHTFSVHIKFCMRALGEICYVYEESTLRLMSISPRKG